MKGVPRHGIQRLQQLQVKLWRMPVHAFPRNEHLPAEAGLKVAKAERPRRQRPDLSDAHEFSRDEVAVVAVAFVPYPQPQKARLFCRVIQLVKHIIDVFDVRL